MSNISKHKGEKEKLKATPGKKNKKKTFGDSMKNCHQMKALQGNRWRIREEHQKNQMTCLKGQNINTPQRTDKMCHLKGCCKAKKS